MQLEIGKKYITRDPKVCEYIEVINFIEDPFYPYLVKFYGGIYDGKFKVYKFDGRHDSLDYACFDLIAEYQEEIKFDLEETQKQLDRLGDLCNWK